MTTDKTREYYEAQVEGPGKFEREPAWTAYFHELSLDGCFDVIDMGEGQPSIYYAEIDADDIKLFPELADDLGKFMAIEESDQGFVTGDIFTQDEIDKLEQAAAANAERESERENEPDDDAITTADHRKFYQYGKLVFTLTEDEDMVAGINRELERMQFWPDVWFISDHGNAHRITLT